MRRHIHTLPNVPNATKKNGYATSEITLATKRTVLRSCETVR